MWGWAPYWKESIKHTISGSELTWADEKWVVGIKIFKIIIQSAVLHEILYIECILSKAVRSTSGEVINAGCKAFCCHDKIQTFRWTYLSSWPLVFVSHLEIVVLLWPTFEWQLFFNGQKNKTLLKKKESLLEVYPGRKVSYLRPTDKDCG